MRFYGLSDTHVLEMPVHRFWLLLGNADRIQASETHSLLGALSAAQGGKEAVRDLSDRLNARVGLVVVEHNEFDPKGARRLKLMSAGKL